MLEPNNPVENLFKKTNIILLKIFKEYMKIDQNNQHLNSLLSENTNILTYKDYSEKFIFFIPEFFLYYVENSFKNIRLLDDELFQNCSKGEPNTITNYVQILSNSNIKSELTDRGLKNYESAQIKKDDENKKAIHLLNNEIIEITNTIEFLNSECNRYTIDFTIKKEEILSKLKKIKDEDMVNITMKVNKLLELKIWPEDYNNNMFGDFFKFKEKLEKAIIIFEETNELEQLEMFSFDFLMRYAEKNNKLIESKLEISKNKLKEFVNKRLIDLNSAALQSKNIIHFKIDNQKKINNQLKEDIKKLQNDEKILVQKIHKEKENFFIKRDQLPETSVYQEFKNGIFDWRILGIIWLIIILIGTFTLF